MQISWRKYIDKTSSNAPRPLLVEALPFVKEKGSALDFGAGALVDTKHLLEQGFGHVTALDNDEASEERSKEIISENFVFAKNRFEDFDYPTNKYDLINAQFAISFIHKDRFTDVFTKILNSLKKGGIITGNIFGDKDEWNKPESDKTFLNKEQFDEFFSNLTIHKFAEEEYDKETALGTMKHWHTLQFIAEKHI